MEVWQNGWNTAALGRANARSAIETFRARGAEYASLAIARSAWRTGCLILRAAQPDGQGESAGLLAEFDEYVVAANTVRRSLPVSFRPPGFEKESFAWGSLCDAPSFIAFLWANDKRGQLANFLYERGHFETADAIHPVNPALLPDSLLDNYAQLLVREFGKRPLEDSISRLESGLHIEYCALEPASVAVARQIQSQQPASAGTTERAHASASTPDVGAQSGSIVQPPSEPPVDTKSQVGTPSSDPQHADSGQSLSRSGNPQASRLTPRPFSEEPKAELPVRTMQPSDIELLLTRSQRQVLATMALNKAGYLWLIEELTNAQPKDRALGDETIRVCILKLKDLGLVERAHGRVGGARLTVRGLQLAKQIPDIE